VTPSKIREPGMKLERLTKNGGDSADIGVKTRHGAVKREEIEHGISL